MTADDQSLDSASWFKPGTYSVWAEEPDSIDTHTPALLVLYEWEISGMRGVWLVEAWGALSELDPQRDPVSEDKHEGRDWCEPYAMVYDESRGEPTYMHPLGLAKMIHSGELKRIGVMPALPGFTEPPSQASIEAAVAAAAPPAGKPVDSHP